MESLKPSGNPMGMGIGDKIESENESEWECKKPFSVVSTLL